MMEKKKVTTATILLLACLCLALPASADTYFGPSRGYVMHKSELPYPGHAEGGIVYFQSATWFQGSDTGYHTSVCVVGLDGYGASIPDLWVEADSALVYNVFYGNWLAHGGFHFSPDSPPACLSLLAEGTCMIVTGRHLDTPDIFGRTTVVDGMTTCP